MNVLFIGESATLCHVSRPLVLSEKVNPEEIDFACSESHRWLIPAEYRFHSLYSAPGKTFLENLRQGKPAYSSQTLERYVRDELSLIEKISPDVVVGDLRLSLTISCKISKVPYWNIANAYWSRHARQPWIIPGLPLTDIISPRLLNPFFRKLRPLAFKSHLRPINRVRTKFGMKNFSGNLCDLYTEADRVLFADSRELVPTYRAPEHHHYLGPILWSTPGKLPDKCRTLDRNKPTVFVTLGSSGPTKVLDTVLAGLLSLGSDLNILLATSKRVDVGPAITNLPNVVVADYLPAREASEMSDMVICHGGSASAYVALAEGKPVLGIPSLLDQHLTIEYVKIRRAGESLRSEYVSVSAIAELVSKMIRDDRLRQHAGLIAQEFRKYEPAKTFSDLINLHIRKNGQGGTLTASQVDHSVLQNTVTKQLFSGFTPIGSSPTVRNAKQ